MAGTAEAVKKDRTGPGVMLKFWAPIVFCLKAKDLILELIDQTKPPAKSFIDSALRICADTTLGRSI